jgi:hypothetical protein
MSTLLCVSGIAFYVISVIFAGWLVNVINSPPQPKEKRKNDEKHKNEDFAPSPSLITYDDLIGAHKMERTMMDIRHQNEVINLEARQQEQRVMWVNYHATPQFIIKPNEDYRKLTI